MHGYNWYFVYIVGAKNLMPQMCCNPSGFSICHKWHFAENDILCGFGACTLEANPTQVLDQSPNYLATLNSYKNTSRASQPLSEPCNTRAMGRPGSAVSPMACTPQVPHHSCHTRSLPLSPQPLMRPLPSEQQTSLLPWLQYFTTKPKRLDELVFVKILGVVLYSDQKGC